MKRGVRHRHRIRGRLPWVAIGFALLLLMGGAVAAANGDDDTAETTEATKKKKERPFVIAPMVISNPAFGNGGGVTALYLYRPRKEDTVSPVSTLAGFGAYSDTGSFFVGLFNKMHLKEDHLRLTMGLAGGRLENEFEIPQLGTAEFSNDIGVLFARSEWRVWRDWFLGAQAVYGDVSYEEGNELSRIFFELYDVEDNASGAFGLVANRDTREHQRYPHEGTFIGFTGNLVPEWLGSEVGYHVIDAEVNHFRSPARGHVLALRAYGRFTPSDTPYSGLSTLGRRSDLRGYTSGEIVAENLISTQAEYRWMFTRRFGAVGFAGAAALYDGDMGNIGSDTLHYSGGVGLRFRLNVENRINFRVDYAWGENDEEGFYVSVGEAF